MFKAIGVLLIVPFIVLGIASCSSPPVEATPSLSDTLPPPTSTFTQPSPTAFSAIIPMNDYCISSFPPVLLPVSNAQGWSEEEIVEKLMVLFLTYFNVPQAPDSCRIEGYRVDEINCDEYFSNLSLVPKGDFVCRVQFSYKPVYQPSATLVGYMDEQNWFHRQELVAVFRSDSGYTMEFARP